MLDVRCYIKNMNQLFKPITDKISHVMWALIINGIVLVVLAVLVAWSSFLLQLLIALAILVLAYSFFYGAYKLRSINNLLKK